MASSGEVEDSTGQSTEHTNPISKPDTALDTSTDAVAEEDLKGTAKADISDPDPVPDTTDTSLPPPSPDTADTSIPPPSPDTEGTGVGDTQTDVPSSVGVEVVSKKQKIDTFPPSAPEVLYQDDWTPKCGRAAVIDRVKGCLYGNALGDAMGLATEFMSKEQAKKQYKGSSPIQFKDIVQDFHRTRWEAGDWTDDTDQMLLILEGIVESGGKVEALDFAQKLRNWMGKGFPELGDKGGLGIGLTVHTTLVSLNFLSDPHAAARQVWEESGKYLAANGAVMRTSVLGLPCFNRMETVIRNTLEISKATHADPRCSASCVAVTTLISQLLQSSYPCTKEELAKIIETSIGEGVKLLEGEKLVNEFVHHMQASSFEKLKLDEAKAIGYTLKCAGSAFVGLRSKVENAKQFIRVMTELVREAGDADTNGAVCGAVIGCKIGYSNLPHDWIEKMPNLKWFDKKVDQFLTCLGLGSEENITAAVV